jgi:hypothetical protein
MLKLGWGDQISTERHCESDEEREALRAAKRVVKYRQVGGDDGYCYVVFKYGSAMMRGLTLREAQSLADRYLREYVKATTTSKESNNA